MQEKEQQTPDTVQEDHADAALMPLVALRGLVAFPHMVIDFEVGRSESKAAVDAAVNGDRRILLVAQRDQSILQPKARDLFRVGVICEIRQVMRAREGTRVLVEGIARAKITKLVVPEEDGCWQAEYKPLPTYSRTKSTPMEMQAIVNSVKDSFASYCRLSHRMPREFAEMVLSEVNPQMLFEGIWSNFEFDYHDRQLMLEESSLFLRLTMLYAVLVRENEVLKIETELQNSVQSRIDQGQREMYLREQQRAISEELGDGEGSDAQKFLKQIEKLAASDEVKEKLRREANQLTKLPSGSQEAYVIANYLETVLGLPWGTYSKEKLDINKAEALLNKEHYGLKRVKERVLEAMSVHAIQPKLTGQIICLVGPPGVGKTSIAQSVAKALGRNYVRVSLGGVRDEAEIRGHRKTYVGAMPGRVIEAIKNARSMNPLVLLDEIDKINTDDKENDSVSSTNNT